MKEENKGRELQTVSEVASSQLNDEGQKAVVKWKTQKVDFLGGPVVKNLPANAGDMGSIPGPGRSHMPWGN